MEILKIILTILFAIDCIVLTAIVLLPFTGILVNIACKIVKDNEAEDDIAA